MCTVLTQAEVWHHFNCSTLEGAKLEDQGVSGTMLTHWEKRDFEIQQKSSYSTDTLGETCL